MTFPQTHDWKVEISTLPQLPAIISFVIILYFIAMTCCVLHTDCAVSRLHALSHWEHSSHWGVHVLLTSYFSATLFLKRELFFFFTLAFSLRKLTPPPPSCMSCIKKHNNLTWMLPIQQPYWNGKTVLVWSVDGRLFVYAALHFHDGGKAWWYKLNQNFKMRKIKK